MISVEQAVTNLKRKYPKRKVTGAIDYDSYWWILEAPEGDKPDMDSPFYAVSKQTGEVKSYSPVADIDKFSEVYPDKLVKFQNGGGD